MEGFLLSNPIAQKMFMTTFFHGIHQAIFSTCVIRPLNNGDAPKMFFCVCVLLCVICQPVQLPRS